MLTTKEMLAEFCPAEYTLTLDLCEAKATGKFYGATQIRGGAFGARAKFNVGENLKITGVRVGEQTAEFEQKDGFLTVALEEWDEADGLGVEISVLYEGMISETMVGLYRSTYEFKGEEKQILATQFEPNYAQRCFPCIDDPEAKAAFTVIMMTPDDGDVVLSNMPAAQTRKGWRQGPLSLSETEVTGGEKVVWHEFEQSPKMSSYLVALVVGPLHGKTVTSKDGVEITSYCALNQPLDAVDFPNEVAARALDYYDHQFGQKYPLKKMDQVALPDFDAGAMENWGLITYRQSHLLVDKTSTLESRRANALTICHELSHQWFGDLVTMKWWDDLWLNESFAAVIEYFAVDALYPEFRAWDHFFLWSAFAALKRDALPGVQSVHQDVSEPDEIATLFDPSIVYAKGARLMLMLIRLLGYDKFCTAISGYFAEHAYANAAGDDLWKALQKVADFDVAEFMHAWINQPGYPVLTREGEGWAQKRFCLNPPEDLDLTATHWPLPKVTADMSGHYLIELSEDEFAQKLEKFGGLTTEEKIRLLFDRLLLAQTTEVESASLLDLAAKFRDEEDGAVWEAASRILHYLKIFMRPETGTIKEYRAFVRNVTGPLTQKVGTRTSASDDSDRLSLRSTLLAYARYGRNEEVLHELCDQYQEDWAALDAETRSFILSSKLYFDEKTVFADWVARYPKMDDPEIREELLATLALVREPENAKKLVALLDDREFVRPQDFLTYYLHLRTNRHAKAGAFKWMREHWGEIEKLVGKENLDSFARYTANSVKTEEELAEYRAFFDPMKNQSNMKRAIEVAEREMQARLDLIKTDGAKVAERLHSL